MWWGRSDFVAAALIHGKRITGSDCGIPARGRQGRRTHFPPPSGMTGFGAGDNSLVTTETVATKDLRFAGEKEYGLALLAAIITRINGGGR